MGTKEGITQQDGKLNAVVSIFECEDARIKCVTFRPWLNTDASSKNLLALL